MTVIKHDDGVSVIVELVESPLRDISVWGNNIGWDVQVRVVELNVNGEALREDVVSVDGVV